MATAQEIQNWLAANQGASDADVYSAMRRNNITPEQLQAAVGGNLAGYQDRYTTQQSLNQPNPVLSAFTPTAFSGSSSTLANATDFLKKAQVANTVAQGVTSLFNTPVAPISLATSGIAEGGLLGGIGGVLGAVAGPLQFANVINSIFKGRSEERQAKDAAQRAEYLRTHPWAPVDETLQAQSQMNIEGQTPFFVSTSAGWQPMDMGTPQQVADKVASGELKPWQNPDGSWVAIDQQGYITDFDPTLQKPKQPQQTQGDTGGGGGGASGGSNGAPGDNVDTTILTGDPTLMGGNAGGGDVFGNGGDFGTTPVQPEVTNPTPKDNPKETGVLDRPGYGFEAPTTREGWLQVVTDWLSRFPNATDAEKQAATEKYGVPADVITEAEQGTGGSGGNASGSGNVPNIPTAVMPPVPGSAVVTENFPSRTSTSGTGTGVGSGTGTGTGSGSGAGSGSGGLFSSPTRTSEALFPELYKNTQKFTLLGNLLSQNRGFYS